MTKAFGEGVQALLRKGPVTDKRKPGVGSFKPTQQRLADECDMQPETLSRKLRGEAQFADYDYRAIGSTLIWWGLITRRSQLQDIFALANYTLPEASRRDEPWKSLLDDTIPLKTPNMLPIQNASFEDWRNDEPAKWLCNTKTGRVKPVPGRAVGSKALEIVVALH